MSCPTVATTKFPLGEPHSPSPHDDHEKRSHSTTCTLEVCSCKLTKSHKDGHNHENVSSSALDCIEIISESGNLYYAPLPFPCTAIWSLGIGLLISTQYPSTTKQQNEEEDRKTAWTRNQPAAAGRGSSKPSALSLFHPYDEPKPVAILQQQPLQRLREQWRNSCCNDNHHKDPWNLQSALGRTPRSSVQIRTPSRKRSSSEDIVSPYPLVEIFMDGNEKIVQMLPDNDILVTFNTCEGCYTVWKIQMSPFKSPDSELLPLTALLRDVNCASHGVPYEEKQAAIRWMESFANFKEPRHNATDTEKDKSATMSPRATSFSEQPHKPLYYAHGGVGTEATTPLRTLSLVRRDLAGPGAERSRLHHNEAGGSKHPGSSCVLPYVSFQQRVPFPSATESDSTKGGYMDEADLAFDKIEITQESRANKGKMLTRPRNATKNPPSADHTTQHEGLFPEVFFSRIWSDKLKILPDAPIEHSYTVERSDFTRFVFVLKCSPSKRQLCFISPSDQAVGGEELVLRREADEVIPFFWDCDTSSDDCTPLVNSVPLFIIRQNKFFEIIQEGASICSVEIPHCAFLADVLQNMMSKVYTYLRFAREAIETAFGYDGFTVFVFIIGTIIASERSNQGYKFMKTTLHSPGRSDTTSVTAPLSHFGMEKKTIWNWFLALVQIISIPSMYHSPSSDISATWSAGCIPQKMERPAKRTRRLFRNKIHELGNCGTEGTTTTPVGDNGIYVNMRMNYSADGHLTLVEKLHSLYTSNIMRCCNFTTCIRIARVNVGIILSCLRKLVLESRLFAPREILKQYLSLGKLVLPETYLLMEQENNLEPVTYSWKKRICKEELMVLNCLNYHDVICWSPVSITGQKIFEMRLDLPEWTTLPGKAEGRRRLLQCYYKGHHSHRTDIQLLKRLFHCASQATPNFFEVLPSTLETQLTCLRTPPGVGRIHTGFSLGMYEAQGTTLNKEPAEKSPIEKMKTKKESDLDGLDLATRLGSVRFPQDMRLHEICNALRTSQPKLARLERPPEVDDHKWTHLQQKHLLIHGRRVIACCVGRGMVTFGSVIPSMADTIPVPPLTVAAKLLPERVVVNLDLGSVLSKAQRLTLWPEFNNGVAAGLRVASIDHGLMQASDKTHRSRERGTNFEIVLRNRQYLRSWLLSHLPKRGLNYAVGGLLYGFGLRGLLIALERMDIYDILSISHQGATIGLLLGLAVSYRKSLNALVNKALTLHLPAAIPGEAGDIEVPEQVQCAAILGIGYLYEGSRHRLMSEFVLSEIGKYPLQPAGGKEKYQVYAYSFVCGAAFGLINLSSASTSSHGDSAALDNSSFERLIALLSSGHDWDAPPGGDTGAEKGASRSTNYIPASVTAPAAALALGLVYMKSEDASIIDALRLPDTKKSLIEMHPFSVLQRAVALSLVSWSTVKPTFDWVESRIPEGVSSILRSMLSSEFRQVKQKEDGGILSRLGIDRGDLNCILQLHCVVLAANVLSIGLRFAGTADTMARNTCLSVLSLIHLMRMADSHSAAFQRHRNALGVQKCSPSAYSFADVTLNELSQNSINNIAPDRWTTENCTAVCAVACGMIMAGTGDITTMRAIRTVRSVTDKNIAYGHHTGYNMAYGMLGLCGGRAAFARDNESIASLLISVLPPFPSGSYDNRYYPQFARHLYALAVERRALSTVDADTLQEVSSTVIVREKEKDSSSLKVSRMVTPCLLPPFESISRIDVTDSGRYELGISVEKQPEQKLWNGIILPVKSLQREQFPLYSSYPRLHRILYDHSLAVLGENSSLNKTKEEVLIDIVYNLVRNLSTGSLNVVELTLVKSLMQSKWMVEQLCLASQAQTTTTEMRPLLRWVRDIASEMQERLRISATHGSLVDRVDQVLSKGLPQSEQDNTWNSILDNLKPTPVVSETEDADNESEEPLRVFDSICVQ